MPEPFLIVGLIAGTRRILVLPRSSRTSSQQGEAAFRNGMIELAILGALILALVVSLVLLRRRPNVGRASASRDV